MTKVHLYAEVWRIQHMVLDPTVVRDNKSLWTWSVAIGIASSLPFCSSLRQANTVIIIALTKRPVKRTQKSSTHPPLPGAILGKSLNFRELDMNGGGGMITWLWQIVPWGREDRTHWEGPLLKKSGSHIPYHKTHFILLEGNLIKPSNPYCHLLTDNREPMTGNQRLMINNGQPTAYGRQPMTNDQWPMANDQWPTTDDRQPTTND